MSRVLKYRAWDIEQGHMLDWDDFSQEPGLVPMLFGDLLEPMQYTGIKDHSGTEIYEKDIVRFTHPNPNEKNKRPVIDMVVGWKAKKGCWALFWKSAKGDLLWSSLGKQLDDNHIVVGNAYENPELVK